MKNPALKVLLTAAVLIPLAVYAQPRPGNPTTATVITCRTITASTKTIGAVTSWTAQLESNERGITARFEPN